MSKGIVSNRGGIQVVAGGATVLQGEAVGQTGATITFVQTYTYGATGVLLYRNGVLMDKVGAFSGGTGNAEEYQEVNNGASSTQFTLNVTDPAIAADFFQLIFMEGTATVGTGGGSGVGDADTLFVDNADDSDIGDFVVDGAVISQVDPINGTDVFVITHHASLSKSIQKTFDIPPKFRGKNLTITIDGNSNATAGNVVVTMHDVTNATDLLTNEQINLVDSLLESRKTSLTFDCPESCIQMYYKIEGLAESSAISRVDDITIKLTKRASTEVLEYEQEKNVFSATIDGSAGPGVSVLSQSSTFISSVSETITGTYIVTFVPGFFLEAPAITAITVNPGTNGKIEIDLQPTTSSVQFRTSSSSTNPGLALDFNFLAQRQGLDYREQKITKIIEQESFQDLLVEESDSMIRLHTANGVGSVNNRIQRFLTVLETIGSATTYVDSATEGGSFTVNEAGMYDITYSANYSSGDYFGLSLNTTEFTTSIPSIASADRLVVGLTHASDNPQSVSWQGLLKVGDVIRAHTAGSGNGASPERANFTMSKQGSLKKLQTNPDAKVGILTSEVRVEVISFRGSVDTAILGFDNLTKVRGGGLIASTTAANGTVFEVVKDGIVDINASVRFDVAGDVYLTKNQAVLNAAPTLEETISHETTSFGTYDSNLSASVACKAGDQIRLVNGGSAFSGVISFMQATHQELEVAVSVSNILPQYEDVENTVELNTGNGRGSTNTSIRRLSNLTKNTGSAIQYTDSATDGARFDILEDGHYAMSWSDLSITGAENIGFSRNSTQLTTSIQNINAGDRLSHLQTGGASQPNTASWTGHLEQGDIIRPHCNTNFTTTNNAYFSITKIPLPSITDVDVSTFIDANISDGPVGEIIFLDSAVAPENFLYANGAQKSRTLYSELFGIIGTQYGVGDGSTTFNLPDLTPASQYIRYKSIAARLYNIPTEENAFSARILNQSGTATIASQSMGFIDSVLTTLTGKVQVNFISGFFKEAPVVTASATDRDGRETTIGTTATTNSVIVSITDGGVPENNHFNIQVSRQGTDRKDLERRVVQLTDFVRVNNTITQEVLSSGTGGDTYISRTGLRWDLETVSSTGSTIVETRDDAGGTRFVALRDCVITLSYSAQLVTAGTSITIRRNGVDAIEGNAAFTTNAESTVSGQLNLRKDDYLTLDVNGSGIRNSATETFLAISAQAQELEKITNVKDEENVFSARIQNNSTASILSQNAEFISSVNRTALGDVEINFVPGFFGQVPTIQVDTQVSERTTYITDTPTITQVLTTTKTEAQVKEDRDFDIIVQRQGSDTKTLADKVIELTDFADVTKVQSQEISHNLAGLLNNGATNNKIKFDLTQLNDSREGILSYSNIIDTEKTVFIAEKACTVDFNAGTEMASGGGQLGIYRNGILVGKGSSSYVATANANVSTQVKLVEGDQIWIQTGSVNTSGAAFTLSIIAKADERTRLYSLEQAENEFSARIQNNGTATVTSRSSDFIESVVRDSLGTVTVTFLQGFFTEVPAVQASIDEAGAHNRLAEPTDLSLGSVSFETRATSGSLFDLNFSIHLSRQGSDRKDLSNAIVESDGFPRINRTLTQTISHSAAGNTLLERTNEIRFDLANLSSVGSFIFGIQDNPGATSTDFVATRSARVDASFSIGLPGANHVGRINLNGNIVAMSSAYTGDRFVSASASFDVVEGDIVNLSASEIINTATETYFNLHAEAQDLERVGNIDQHENVFSAKVENNGAASLISESSSFIQSVTRVSLGRVDVVFIPGFFAEAPSVVPNAAEASGDFWNANAYAITAAGFSVIAWSESPFAQQDRPFDVMVQRQGSDYKSIQDIVVALPPVQVMNLEISGDFSSLASTTAYKIQALSFVSGDIFGSVAGNQLSLEAGDYLVDMPFNFYGDCDQSSAGLYDTGTSTYIFDKIIMIQAGGGPNKATGIMKYKFTLNASAILEFHTKVANPAGVFERMFNGTISKLN